MIDKFQEEEYKLKRNPFTGYRATREELKFWVNREEEINTWKKVISETISHPENHYIFFIVGDYGMGKSLSIYKLEKICEEDKNLFSLAFNFLGEDKMRRPGIELIQRIFKYVDFTRFNIAEKQIEKLSIISKDVFNVFYKILFGDNETRTLALYFLRGQIIPNQSQIKKLEVMRKIIDVEIIREYFLGFLYLLKIAKYRTLVLLIDEFEYLFSLVQKTQRDFYFALLRGLYDLPTKINTETTANILFFLGISRDEIRRMSLMEEAEKTKKVEGPVVPFMRRVYKIDELKPLKKKSVEELINLRLRYDRVKKQFEELPLIPYTEDFVDFIWKHTGGKPGDVIFKCGHILDIGIKYRAPRLNKKFAVKALEERKIK